MFGYGTLLLRFSAQGALMVAGVVLFDSWLSLRALMSVSYEYRFWYVMSILMQDA